MTKPTLPGATIGVLGGGEVAGMFAAAARRLGYRVALYAPDACRGSAPWADTVACGSYDDVDAVRSFAMATAKT